MKFRDFLRLHPMFPVVVIFSLAVAATSYYLGEHQIAYLEFALGIVLSVLILAVEKRNYGDLKRTVSMVNSYIVSKDEDRISSIPLPFVICSESGGIIWYNKLFESEVIGDKELTFRQIRNFVPADKLKSDSHTSSFNANYNGRRYTVYISKSFNDAADEYVLYFIDDTYYKNTADEYKASKPAVMLISIDAMDEVSSMVSQNEYTTLVSDDERMINSWFTHYMCIFRKLSEGRYIVIAEYNTFEEMKKDKFNILDRVREHHIEGLSTAMTVSVGIGTGMNLSSCEAAARRSLDMAKGRGGDQVVINDNENYEFFGGVASGVESRNQVQSRIVAASVEELIKHASSVLIMGHKNSDLDALGSAIGLSEAVRRLGIPVRVVVDEKNTMAKPLLDYYRSEYDENLFISPEKAENELEDESLVIVTDVMRPSFSDAPELLKRAERIVVIDHHRMSVDHISNSTIFYHEPNSSSASEMVAELIRYMPSKPKLSKYAAEGLLSGIYLDTKNFTLKAGVRTFEAAAYLKDRGADTITVRKLFSATSEENSMVSEIVNSAVIRGKFAFAKTYRNEPVIRLASSKAADDLLNIEDVDASFVIFPAGGGNSAISARSYGRVNVQIIMEHLGGGGHQTMAAAQFKDTSVDEAEKLLQKAVDDFLERNTKKDKER
ncbi:MAG: DHH family phosphoesterase [Clostridiales bacterium]|nr:DHH family phosphoesterase [Clostridiales bacterium]MCD7828789.1 DHH family phosphoesterase [Clostridiales bacterium]